MLSPRSVGIRIVFMVMMASHRNGLNYHAGRGRGAASSTRGREADVAHGRAQLPLPRPTLRIGQALNRRR